MEISLNNKKINILKIGSLIVVSSTVLSFMSYLTKFSHYNISLEYFEYDINANIVDVVLHLILGLFIYFYIMLEDMFKIKKQGILILYIRLGFFILSTAFIITILSNLNNTAKNDYILKIISEFYFCIVNIIPKIYEYKSVKILFDLITLIFIPMTIINYIYYKEHKSKFEIWLYNIKYYKQITLSVDVILKLINKIIFVLYFFNYIFMIIAFIYSINYRLFEHVYLDNKVDYNILKQEDKEDKIILFKVGDKIFISDFYTDENNICTIYTKNYEIMQYENIKVESIHFKEVIIDNKNLEK